MLQNMPDQRGKKSKLSSEMVNNVALNAINRLYNQRTLERMKALASGESIEEPVKEEDVTEEVVAESIQNAEITSEDATNTNEVQELEVESKVDQSDDEGEETPKE